VGCGCGCGYDYDYGCDVLLSLMVVVGINHAQQLFYRRWFSVVMMEDFDFWDVVVVVVDVIMEDSLIFLVCLL